MEINEISNILRQRLKSLFQFLREANNLRFRPERNISDQIRILKLTNLPEHPSIQLISPCSTEPGQAPIEFEFRISRAKTTPCPAPPEELLEWLVSGWDDPNQPAKHVESQNQLNDDDESVTVFFLDDPQRRQSWQQWNKTRADWVGPEITARQALAFFEQVYELHSFLEKEGERCELMVGDGLLDWKTRSTVETGEVRIHHPLLLKKVELTFDPLKPEFCIVDTDSEPELYTSCLVDIEGINSSGIEQRRKELADVPYHPLGSAETDAYLKALVQTISPTHGDFCDKTPEQKMINELQSVNWNPKSKTWEQEVAPTGPEDEAGEHPLVWREPVIFVRKRSTGFANAITSILDDIDQRAAFPPAFGLITGISPDSDGHSTTDASSPEDAAVPPQINDEEILLAKEANAEQMQIIRKLSFAGSVLVQGPPGTGKTHTIGNIIGHLLSQGQRILVTSHTPKALRVLRSQIPKDLQALCVSVLGSDVDARKQLEASIAEINMRLGRDTVQTLNQKIDQLTQERRKILEDNRNLTRKLRMALESEYLPINLFGKSLTPADAARHIAKFENQYSWLPGPIAWESPFPITDENLTFLYSTNEDFTAQEEQDACRPLPDLAELPTVTQFDDLIKDISSLRATVLDFKKDFWRDDCDADSENLAKLLRDIAKEFSGNHRNQSWRPYAIVAGVQGSSHREVWEVFGEKISTAYELNSRHILNLHFKPTLPGSMKLAKQCEILEEILAYLDQGGKLGAVKLMTRGEWRKLINAASVSTGRPNRREHFTALHCLAKLMRAREEMSQLWEQLIAVRGGSAFSDLGPNPEQSAHPLADEITYCLDWQQSVWLPLVDRIQQLGLNIDKVLAEIPREVSPNTTVYWSNAKTADYYLAEKAGTEVLPDIIEAQIKRTRLAECERQLEQLERKLFQYGSDEANHGCICQLLAAARARDIGSYRQAINYTQKLYKIQPVVTKRKEMIEAIAKSAPSWAAAIAN